MLDRASSETTRRRRRIASTSLMMLLVAAAVVGAAGVLTAMQTPVWTSRAVVLVDVEETGVARAPAMGTEREIASSLVVAQAAARSVRGDAGQMLRQLRVTVPVETNVLQIEYDATSADDAQSGAAAFANAYVAYRTDTGFNGPRTLPRTASVISPADLPQSASKPNWLVNLGTAGLLGLALGVAAGYRRLADALRSRPEAPALPATSELLAVVPARRAGNVDPVLERSGQEEQEFERLCRQVLARTDGSPLPWLLVAGPRNNAWTSSIAWQLAVDLARGGLRTVLVAAATDPASLNRMSSGRTSSGLVGVLNGRRDPRTALLPTGVSGLSVLPPGTAIGTGSLLARHGLRGVLKQLARCVDFVVVDAGPVLGARTALEAATDIPTALIVLGPDAGPGDLEAATAELRGRACEVLGAVLVVPHPRGERRAVVHAADSQQDLAPVNRTSAVAAPESRSSLPSPLNGS